MARTTLVLVLAGVFLVGCDRAGGPPPNVTPAKQTTSSLPDNTTPLPSVQVVSLLVEPGGFDFGLIGAEVDRDVQVSLRNTGTTPITIGRVQSTCQCTTPEDLANTTIPPGGSVPMSTRFSTRPVPGPQEAKVVVQFQPAGEPRHRQIVIQMKAEVTLPVKAEPAYVDALEGVRAGQVKLSSIDGRPFQVLTTQGLAPSFAPGGGGEGGGGGSSTEHVVNWLVEYPDDLAQCTGTEKLWWIIETDHPECPILPLRIRHDCTGMRTDMDYKQRGWLFRDYIVNLGSIRAGQPVEADIKVWRLNKQPTINVRSVLSNSADATAELVNVTEPADDDSYVTVRFTPRVGYEGMMYAMINLVTESGNKEIAFVAKVIS